MTLAFTQPQTQDLSFCLAREWLEANGLGGYAASTIAGAHTRRYHGLLVAATRPPVGRMVLLSRLDETLVLEGSRVELGCRLYPGAVHPQGYRHLHTFERGLFPTFVYRADGIRLEKTVAAVHGENTTLVAYRLLEAPAPLVLELRPFVAGRDFHSLTRANDALAREAEWENHVFRVRPYEGVPELYIQVPGASYAPAGDWYYQFEYPVERERGLDFREDLFTYGTFQVPLRPGDGLGIIASTDDPQQRDALELLQKEKQRRERLLAPFASESDAVRALVLAADQFIVRRGKTGRSIIAGYPWFEDWGRDAMIALPGLCLSTGRFRDARQVLLAFSRYVQLGMLPNRFPDGGEEPEYNTADATLWYFVAVHRYLQATGDAPFVRRAILPLLAEILDWHDRGTRHQIHVDSGGLLYAGEPGVQLTWMDAKVGDWVVTPRQGKAVEVNALWYNALKIYADLLRRFDEPEQAAQVDRRAARVKRQFVKCFWYAEGGYLYDVVDGERRDAALRPNQIFALSLPFPLLAGAKARAVLKRVGEKLLTPVGLRSLSPDDPNYHPRYGGDVPARDGAYHQGTVWSWLLGPYVTALVRFGGRGARRQAAALLDGMEPHLHEACVGSISEIFDAEPPFTPRGAAAQAWSVGEWLRAYFEDVKTSARPAQPPPGRRGPARPRAAGKHR